MDTLPGTIALCDIQFKDLASIDRFHDLTMDLDWNISIFLRFADNLPKTGNHFLTRHISTIVTPHPGRGEHREKRRFESWHMIKANRSHSVQDSSEPFMPLDSKVIS